MKKNLFLLFVILLFIIVPLAYNTSSEFAGTDGKAVDAIESINPKYEPWFSNVWELPGGEVESLLFALQAALGAGFIGYFFGLSKGKKNGNKKETLR
ncbi:cobalt/nickel transport protein [Oikeobacillus pervagus]|uniref:Cobalt transport protein CbiN n=1 Tax=Oikeobacillus pervagus TaxID=1325931 RepID=A0AAJ1SZQ3_9BACI|nr:energy-coupling factor ABC transporter substrate-binding protein [Oikeobacillus pervagus]MDQ0214237.1 cobalt/nickel transport protein [Oikeobacillus pervagus]